jgi:signal transduction histidine kinase
VSGPAGGDGDVLEEELVRLVHDLRTPLTIVSGFTEMLLRRGDEIDAEQRREFLERIDEGAREMRAILDAGRAGRSA